MNLSTSDSKKGDHRRSHRLLPWFVNGTLEGYELERFEAHLESCDRCRSELEEQERLAYSLRAAEEIVFSPDRAFDALAQRIEAEEDKAARSRPVGRRDRLSVAWHRLVRPETRRWRLAVAAQAVAIVALAAVVGYQARVEEPRFQVLSNESAAIEGPTLRIVFVEEITESDRSALVTQIGGRIVDGPSPFGVYTISVPEELSDGALERLRASNRVQFIEPGRSAR